MERFIEKKYVLQPPTHLYIGIMDQITIQHPRKTITNSHQWQWKRNLFRILCCYHCTLLYTRQKKYINTIKKHLPNFFCPPGEIRIGLFQISMEISWESLSFSNSNLMRWQKKILELVARYFKFTDKQKCLEGKIGGN